MGHYYSEMHASTPHEIFGYKFEKSLLEMGYHNIEMNYKVFYSCDWCGCLVTNLPTHLAKCSAGDRSIQIDKMTDQAIEFILAQPEPIKLLDLVSLLSEKGVSVYALNCAIESLLSEKKVTRQAEPYQDTIISLV